MIKKDKWFLPCMIVILVLQFFTILYFCNLKQGFHFDEFYSYYSSNATNALFLPEAGWKDVDEIRSEFDVGTGESLNYPLVNQMQSMDVHPPFYYFLLHTVCGMTKGIFSKWQGISLNLIFFVLSWLLLAKITSLFTKQKQSILAVCLLYGFSPAVYSGITFVRMYVLLSFECLLLLYIHLKACRENCFTWKNFYLPVAVMSFLGFYTHYYFFVFLFFTAAPVFLYGIVHKGLRKNAIFYALSVVGGMLLTVIAYPACLRHIFAGYRGTEAMDAFFSVSNFVDRLNFFFDLTGEYNFGNTLVFVTIIVIMLLLTYGLQKKRHGGKISGFSREAWLLIIVTLGYFLVVAKTALLNAEEAIRYEMPIYGLLIVLTVLCLEKLPEKCMTVIRKEYPIGNNAATKKKVHGVFFAVIVACICIGQLHALSQKKVCFLYEGDRDTVAWATEHSMSTVCYIYNSQNQWMIWDDSMELMQYENIYFLDSTVDSFPGDADLSNSGEIYAYVMRGEDAKKQLQKLAEINGKNTSVEKIRELLYCDLYLIR